MADFKENIVTGKKYRVCTDASTNSWDRVSMWTSAADVEMADGKSVEKSVSDLTESLNNFSFTTQDGVDGYMKDGEFHPFSKGTVKELLWVNPSPTSNFAAQTLSLNLTDYEAIIIEFRQDTSDSSIVNKTYFEKSMYSAGAITNYGAGAMSSSGVSNTRNVTNITDTGITFTECRGASSYNTNRIIPTKIYGLKQGIPSAIEEIKKFTDYRLYSRNETKRFTIEDSSQILYVVLGRDSWTQVKNVWLDGYGTIMTSTVQLTIVDNKTIDVTFTESGGYVYTTVGYIPKP